MPISQEYFYNLSKPLLDRTEEFSLNLLTHIKDIAERLVRDPSAMVDLSNEERRAIRLWQSYTEDAKGWADNNLPKAYLKGIKEADGFIPEGATATGGFSPISRFGDAELADQLSKQAREILKEVPDHLTAYGVFQQSIYNDFNNTRIPIIRSATDKIQRLVVEASDEAYRTADTLTRRELTQSIMRGIADEGITGIRYSDGRTMRIDSYAEMVARTQTGNANRQANLNRLQEYGRDLVVISSHYPVSPLCEPWQGRVYSISGSDENYPPLDRAISGGLYHANCKHSQSGYSRGSKIPEAREQVNKRENERRYQAQQTQRYNERKIRFWKRREATAITDAELQKAKNKVSQWQERQRELIDSNDYLRRKYDREAV